MQQWIINKFSIFLLCFAMLANPVWASHDTQLDRIMQAEQPPGIVFDVMSRKADYLDWAIKEINRLSQKIRSRYPKLPIAVVSHSREQFALANDQKSGYQEMHRQVKSLVEEQDIPVHVCGVSVERRGLDAKDFPE